jgi:hypothetical protein
MTDDLGTLIAAAQRRMAGQQAGNPYLDLLEAGRVPREELGGLAGELYHLVRSDGRSLTLLAARFSGSPAGELFSELADGEREALRLLLDFGAALSLDERRLAAHEPALLTQAYPACLAQTAAFGSRSDMLLALLANVGESGRYYARTADALVARYGFDEDAVAHFRFFADTPPDLLDRAAALAKECLAEGDDPGAAVRTAWLVHAYEHIFWKTLAEGIDSA